MEDIIIKIPDEVSIYIQKLFYEYNSYLNILTYLSNECKSKEYFDEYFKEAAEKNMELELVKAEVFREYKPDCSVAAYSFDFDDRTMICKIGCCCNEEK